MILHLSGRDKPGITASLSQCLADNNAILIDLGQSLLHGFLNLSAIVDIPVSSSLVKNLLVLSQEHHMKLEIVPFVVSTSKEKITKKEKICVTLLGSLSASLVAQVTQELAKASMNLGEIRTLSSERLEGMELLCENNSKGNFEEKFGDLQETLYLKAKEFEFDISIQKDTLFRRNRRLVLFDVDSTFIPFEIIDELGSLLGKKDEISRITEKAMAGEIDFQEALRERVKLLKGLPLDRARLALQNIKANEGVDKLVKVLRALGCKMGLVSGGFDFFVTQLRKDYGLDFSFSNKLKTENGIITGEIEGPIVDAARKAQILKDMCEAYQCTLEQCVAVGDGSNDVEMLKTAGLGIAYLGKSTAQKAADVRFNHRNLSDILYLMGIKSEEVDDINLH